MFQTVNYWAPRISDFLPISVKESAELVDLPLAISQIHFPDSLETLRAARNRLAFDEIFLLQVGVLQQKRQWESVVGKEFPCEDTWLENTSASLPFELTNAQKNAINDIREDLVSGRPMNRLLQGDVGAGKTIIAALTIAIVTRHGSQSALMSPTSILAEQHYKNLTKYLSETLDAGLVDRNQVRLLIGDTPSREKEEIREGLQSGQIKVSHRECMRCLKTQWNFMIYPL